MITGAARPRLSIHAARGWAAELRPCKKSLTGRDGNGEPTMIFRVPKRPFHCSAISLIAGVNLTYQAIRTALSPLA